MALTKVKAGNILLTTAAASSNDTTPATTQYVTTAINNLIDGAPATLNTLDEIAAALNDDAALNTTLTNAIAAKLPLAGGALTGDLDISGGTVNTVGFSANRLLRLQNTSTTDGSRMGIAFQGNASIGSGLAWIEGVNYDQSIGATDIRFSTYSGSAWNSDMMTLSNNGNVGIGVTSPTELLHIKNPSNSWNEYAKIRIGTETTDSYASEIGFHRGTTNDNDRGFFIDGGGAGTQHFKVLHGGNVGIGTTAPNAPLTVWTTSSASSQMALRLNNPGGFASAGAGAELVFSQDRSTSEDYRMAAITSGQQYAGSSSGADLKFWTRHSSSITNKMTLAADGTLILKPNGVTTGLQLEGRASDNNFFIQFNTHAGAANKASIGTDTGNDTLQYGANNHKFVNQATNATAMSFPATNVPRVHVGSGNQNAATGKRGIRVGRTIYNWFNYGRNDGHTYLHIKTNLVNTSNNTQPTMSMLHIKGYTYGIESIDSMLGFHNWSGSIHNPVYTNNGTRTVVDSSWVPYVSSDNYCVIVLSIGNNYPGISIDYHQAFDTYSFQDIDVLAYSKSANTSGVY